MKKNSAAKSVTIFLVFVVSSQLSLAQDEAECQKNFNIEKGIMLSG